MSETLRAGDVLSDRFRIERELGSGAMAVVFLAHDLRHGREVAVKVLDTRSETRTGTARFLDEIRTAARLNHPNILAIHDSGEIGGRPYYVTPRIEGETLRERLERVGRLDLEEALVVARQLAAALAHAHAAGVIHRDLKPDNVLLDRAGNVYLADFGIARSVNRQTRHTEQGALMGTPHYMSPEQIEGELDLDGRSDLYSLGCLLFETLVGEAPYADKSGLSVLSSHLTAPPPSIRERRADVPPEVDAAVRRAMAKERQERHATAAAFARALERPLTAVRPPLALWPAWTVPSLAKRGTFTAAFAAVAVAAVTLATHVIRDTDLLDWVFPPPPVDTMRYAIFPARVPSGVVGPVGLDLLLHEAFGRWREIRLVDRLQLGDAAARLGGEAGLTSRQALEIAKRLGAGRFVHASASQLGDSLHVDAVLYETGRHARVLHQASIRVAPGTVPGDSLVGVLSERLLFGDLQGREMLPWSIGTNSYAALRDYGLGHAALDVWELQRADSLFRSSVSHDPDFVGANLWVAQVSDWLNFPLQNWEAYARRAERSAEELPDRERLMARALALMALREFPAACDIYSALLDLEDGGFIPWYGLGQCRRRDELVIANVNSPTGWSFRASHHLAIQAYRRAFEDVPIAHKGFRERGFAAIRDLFFTSADRIIFGQTSPRNNVFFFGYPVQNGDSLVVVPYPQGDQPDYDDMMTGILQRRGIFRSLALHWANTFPMSSEALYALALSEEMLGDATALQTLRRARSLHGQRGGSLQMAAAEVWLRCKLALPDDLSELHVARALADSLLREASPSNLHEARLLAELAALLGRPSESARLAQQTVAEYPRAPLERARNALEAFAAVGFPAESIAAWEGEVAQSVRHFFPPEEVAAARFGQLERATLLAFGNYTLRSVEINDGSRARSDQGRALILLNAGAHDEATATLRIIEESRRGSSPEDLSIDALVIEAALWRALGDIQSAISLLDATLSRIRYVQPDYLNQPLRSGSLVRAMVLRAELAADAGDRGTARRWAAAVLALWGEGEPGVAPVVRSMATLAQDSNR